MVLLWHDSCNLYVIMERQTIKPETVTVKGKNRMKPIYQYTCHLQFIKHRCAVMKENSCYISNRYITNKLGQKSTQAFYRIINGKMKISDSNIIKIVDILKLDTSEAAYFTILVHLNQAKTLPEKAHSTNKILNFIKTNPRHFSYSQCQFFITNHYVSLLKTLAENHHAYYEDLKTFLLEPEQVSAIKETFSLEQKQNSTNNTPINGKTHTLLQGLPGTIKTDTKIPVNRQTLKQRGKQG